MTEAEFTFINNLFMKIKETANGKVSYKKYDKLNAVIFIVLFKDFKFEYAVDSLSEKVYSGYTTDQAIVDFKEQYKKEILKAFFKRQKTANDPFIGLTARA